MIADFWDAMEEAERVRSLSLMGLHELTYALEREETRLGVDRDANNLDAADVAVLQAAYERAEWAKAELANESPHGNAQALISMNSALDAMVEELVIHLRAFHVKRLADEVLANAWEAAGDAVQHLGGPVRAALERAVREEVELAVPKPLRPRGSGIERYEKPLRRVGWGAPASRPIPEDLDAALAEIGALRDVLVHRAGRVDDAALAQAPTLPYSAGQFVRISRSEYRKYSAAIRCYTQEIGFRGIRGWPDVTDESHGPDLARWRDYVTVNA